MKLFIIINLIGTFLLLGTCDKYLHLAAIAEKQTKSECDEYFQETHKGNGG